MIKGKEIILRACEPSDVEILYHWENDTSVWHVTNTYIPYSRNTLAKYLDSVQDIYTDKQLRLMIEKDDEPVGMIDLFEYEPYHQRAGVGILIAEKQNRNKGIATDALDTLKHYCRSTLSMRILYCNILSSNYPSIQLFTKCGFESFGSKPRWHRYENTWIDEEFYMCFL